MPKKRDNKKEIVWNIINSLLAGCLVFFGAFTTGTISLTSIVASLGTSLIVAFTQFKHYWENEKEEYSGGRIFRFL